MIKRTCLIVDDEDQSDIFYSIHREGLRKGIDIECIQFNIGSPSEVSILDNQMVSSDKVLSVFKERFNGIKFHLIAVDWDLNNPVLTGPLFIKLLNDNNLRNKIPKMLYSGVLKDEIEDVCNRFKSNQKSFADIWKIINTLITTDIRKFCIRDNYSTEIVSQLYKVEDSFESSTEDILRKFPDLVFKNGFPNAFLQGKKFSEILTLVENDYHLRNELNRVISEQVVAYLTERL